MVAPGDGLEFRLSPAFQRVDKKVPGLAAAVRQFYSDHPTDVDVVSAELRRGQVTFEGKEYEFLFLRRGPSKVFLLYVAQVVNGVGVPADDLRYFIQLYKQSSGGSHA